MKKKYLLTLIGAFSLGVILSSCSGCKKQGSGNNVAPAAEQAEPAQITTEEVQTTQEKETTQAENTPQAEVTAQDDNTAIAEENVPTEQTVPENETANVQAKVEPPIDENTITEGRAFPSLEFTSFTGEQVSLAGLKGKVVLIDFWAAWCGPCVRAMPDVIETYKEYHDKGFEIIGISLDRDKSQFENYIKANKITWQQYYDGLYWSNKIARRFNIRAIPHIVIVDKDGSVAFNTDYDLDKEPLRGQELKNFIAKLCAAPSN
ncbi:MAG: TlpA disulfide reductase family protein [Sedimentisphaerales bacterium]